MHLKSREGLYSAVFLWREREQVRTDGAESTRGRGSCRRKGNLGQGRNRSSGCRPSQSPLQMDFPLPYFLVLKSAPPTTPQKKSVTVSALKQPPFNSLFAPPSPLLRPPPTSLPSSSQRWQAHRAARDRRQPPAAAARRG